MGVPEGDGSAVVIIPGLLCMDLVLSGLHSWLARIGYRPYFSGMDFVADCPDLLARRLAATIRRAYMDTGCRVHLNRTQPRWSIRQVRSGPNVGPYRFRHHSGYAFSWARHARICARLGQRSPSEDSQSVRKLTGELRHQPVRVRIWTLAPTAMAQIRLADSHLYPRRRARSLAILPDW